MKLDVNRRPETGDDPDAVADGRSRRRRDAIVEAARSEFRRTGLAATSLASIADAAGIRRSHLYRYVDDKADLVGAVVAAETRAINARRLAALDGVDGFAERVVRSLELAVELVDGDPFWASLIEPGNVPYTAYAAAKDPELLASNAAYWAPILAAARDEGELDPDLADGEVMTWLLGVQFLLLERREIFPAESIRRYVERFVVASLVAR